jgi:hypothetical protein
MPYGGNDWLALTQEPTLEPEIPICDPHYLPATTQRWRREPDAELPLWCAFEAASSDRGFA